jgi:hypothetical protein
MGNNLFANNAVGALASSINDTVTEITLGAGEGAVFPTPTGDEYFYVVVYDASNNREIMKVTAKATNTFTVVRGQDGTSARSFAANDAVELRMVAASENNFGQKDSENTWAEDQTFSGAVNADSLDVTNDAAVGGAFEVDGATTLNGALALDSDPTIGGVKQPIPAGSIMLFYQNTAPVGWEIAGPPAQGWDNNAIRAVSGTANGGNAGGERTGTISYSNIFKVWYLTSAQMPIHTHYFSASTDTQGEHTHTIYRRIAAGTAEISGPLTNINIGELAVNSNGAGAHSHTVAGNTGAAGSGAGIDFNVTTLNYLSCRKT